MFNSTSRNNDPKPYYVDELVEPGKHDGRVTKAEVELSALEHDGAGGTLYHLARFDPRPEFDNSPNPILLAFRRQFSHRPEPWMIRAAARAELAWMKRGKASCQSVASPAHVEHARKVLHPLAGLGKLVSS